MKEEEDENQIYIHKISVKVMIKIEVVEKQYV